MGMFDYLKVQFPMPNPEHQDLEFQTKSLDCQLRDYTINVCGRLIYGEREDGSYERDARIVQIVDADHHGKIRFYNSPVEYEAIFHHGNCVSIEDLTEYPAKTKGVES